MNHNDDERLDLSALDPSRNGKRWSQLTESVVERALAARRRRLTVGMQMAAWAGPVFAAAAAVALVSWVGALARDSGAGTEAAAVQEPAYVLSTWATNDERPEPSEILEVLGDHHGTE